MESADLLRRMNRALAHRGPDGEGVFLAGSVGLAHRRLAVIDLNAGRQPMVSEDGRTAVVLNGEIYNYKELRAELANEGCRFHTTSDTEVLLRLYERVGRRCIHRLRGMFAFAVWSEREGTLWLARDRVGLKPLYYCHRGPLVLFASEIKAILEHPAVCRAIDERAIDDFLTFGYIPSPRTAFRGIRKLPAGHMVTVSARGLVSTEYWDLDFTPKPGLRGGETAEAVREALEESVSNHLVSDVPLGILLSGGLDSTAVLMSMADEMGPGIPSFTASFRGTGEEDVACAELAASECLSEWSPVAIPEPTSSTLDRLAWHFDEPFADASALPTFTLCQGARRRVPVCLSGDGGDESFGGYRRHRHGRRAEVLGRLLPKPFASNLRHMDVYRRDVVRCDAALKGSLYSDGFRRTLANYDPLSILSEYAERSEGWDPLSQLLYLDFKTFLADGVLTKVDRASMAHGMEVRVPLLDSRLVELAGRIPGGMKVGLGGGKGIFKRALRNVVPPNILRRRKRGFTPPLTRWFRGGLGEIFQDRVLRGDPFVSQFLDVGTVRRLWEDQVRGAPGSHLLLWTILTLETWGSVFV